MRQRLAVGATEIDMKAILCKATLMAAISAFACGSAFAQSEPPTLPNLTADQAEQVEAQLADYRRSVDARIAGGEINPDEGQRLIAWRQWQIANQVAGFASQQPAPPPRRVVREYVYPPGEYVYPPAYLPPPGYVAPYYAGPRYWGPTVCAGGFGHHWGGRVCF